MIRPNGKGPALKHVPEVADGQVDAQQLSIEGTVFDLRRRHLLRKERDGFTVRASMR